MADYSGYFDYAAATPVDERVIEAMRPYWTDDFYNPSALYGHGRRVRKALDEARSGIAQIIGVKPLEVIFTAGGTESNNLAIFGVMSQFPGKKILTSGIEHDSVLRPAEQWQTEQILMRQSGEIDLESLERMINDDVAMISIMYANNEIGVVQLIRKVSLMLEQVRADRSKRGIELPIYFHTDASQAAPYLDLHVHRLGVDLLTLNGGKIYGPKQTGILYVKSGIMLRSLILGGGQERGLRSGTENVAGFIGLHEALRIVDDEREAEVSRLKELQTEFIKAVGIQSRITVNGSLKKRLPNNVHITVENYDNETLVMELDRLGFSLSVGSACSASHEEPSHVLAAIGLSEQQIRSSIRVSFGRYTDSSDVQRLTKALETLLA